MLKVQCLLVMVGFAVISGFTNTKFEDCGKTVGCIKIPSSCTSFADCEAVGSYYYNATEKNFQFELRFQKKWAAFAQNTKDSTNKMVGLRGFYCTRDGSTARFGLLEGVGKKSPNWLAETDVSEASDSQLKSQGGVHMCSFKRTMDVSSANGLRTLYSLNETNLINIIACGDGLKANGDPEKHTSVLFDENLVVDWMRFTMNTSKPNTTSSPTTMETSTTPATTSMSTTSETTQTPTTMTTTTMTTTMSTTTMSTTTMRPMLKFEDCGKTVGCIKIPSSCTSFTDCEAVGSYYYNSTEKNFKFELRFKKKWAAFAQNTKDSTDKMSGLRGFYCTQDGATATFGLLQGVGRRSPSWFPENGVAEASDSLSKSEDGLHMCSFKRTMDITSENGMKTLYSLSETNLINIIAYGDSLQGGGIPAKHTGFWVDENVVADWMKFTMKNKTMDTTGTDFHSSAYNFQGTYQLLIGTLMMLIVYAWM